ncbi:hypothetical protein [Mesorhizobium sp. 8]|uniref:hypothetical protein n=1 Tax=Mesorhizobium sp. 8 TaxID=2584466 RepID=UPI0011246393|nr:hypothetical protein [Mesorhizobium sp. 8]QDC01731.1 hypothetical protein FGU64_15590 [Mesorhizobium sp. 8]
MCCGLKTHSDAIQAACAILGVIIGATGFWFTIDQLQSASTALKAANAYTIQHDARELVAKVAPNIQKLDSGNLNAAEKRDVLIDFWQMLNFYLSVYRQARADGISPEFEAAFRADFCDWISVPTRAAAWDELRDGNKISDRHVAMREAWCAKK